MQLCCCYFFLIGWRAPDPPLPDYGVEVNFGIVDAGSGEIQSLAPANTNPANENAKKGDPEPQPEVIESQPQPVPENKVVEKTPEAETEDEPLLAPEEVESPVVVKKKEIEKKREEPKEEPVVTKETEQKREEVVVKKAPEKKEEPKPLINNSALMTSKKEGAGGTKEGTSDKLAGNNNGDKPGAVGDQGNPEGKLEAKALYGTPGGGGGGGTGGASYNIRGWNWDSKPQVKDNSDESGRIVFQVKIDEDGRIISVVPVEKTLSPAVVAFYKKEVEKLTFSPTSENTVPAPISTGTITFIIKSK